MPFAHTDGNAVSGHEVVSNDWHVTPLRWHPQEAQQHEEVGLHGLEIFMLVHKAVQGSFLQTSEALLESILSGRSILDIRLFWIAHLVCGVRNLRVTSSTFCGPLKPQSCGFIATRNTLARVISIGCHGVKLLALLDVFHHIHCFRLSLRFCLSGWIVSFAIFICLSSPEFGTCSGRVGQFEQGIHRDPSTNCTKPGSCIKCLVGNLHKAVVWHLACVTHMGWWISLSPTPDFLRHLHGTRAPIVGAGQVSTGKWRPDSAEPAFQHTFRQGTPSYWAIRAIDRQDDCSAAVPQAAVSPLIKPQGALSLPSLLCQLRCQEASEVKQTQSWFQKLAPKCATSHLGIYSFNMLQQSVSKMLSNFRVL